MAPGSQQLPFRPGARAHVGAPPAARMQRVDPCPLHPRSKQLVLADDTLHSFLSNRESDTIWLLAPAIRDELRLGPPVGFVWRGGQQVLRWRDPRVRQLQPSAANPAPLLQAGPSQPVVAMLRAVLQAHRRPRCRKRAGRQHTRAAARPLTRTMGLSPLQQLLRVLPTGTKLMEKLQEKGGVDFERGKKQAMLGL